MSNLRRVWIAGLLLQGAALHAEANRASILEIRSSNCPQQKVETETEGNFTVFYNRKGPNNLFCTTIAKILVPQGYALQSDLKAELTVGANLWNSDDKVFMQLKVQTDTQVDKTLRSLILTTDRPSSSKVTLNGEVALPNIGNCLKDREASISFAGTAKIVKAFADTDASVSLIKLEVPALKLLKLSCPDPTPTPEPTPTATPEPTPS